MSAAKPKKKETSATEKRTATKKGLSEPGSPVPISIFKDKQDPVELENKDYPEWLWSTLKAPRTLEEIQREGLDSLSAAEQRNFQKRSHRLVIREKNQDAKERK